MSSYFSTENLVFARINLKPAALKNFVFDWEACLRLCEVYHFQNLVGLELPIKHTLKLTLYFENKISILQIIDDDELLNVTMEANAVVVQQPDRKDHSPPGDESGDLGIGTNSRKIDPLALQMEIMS